MALTRFRGSERAPWRGIFVASTMDRTLWAAGGALNGIDSHVARSYHWPQRGQACELPYCELIWEIPTKSLLLYNNHVCRLSLNSMGSEELGAATSIQEMLCY